MNKMIKLLIAALAFIVSFVSTAVHAALPANVATQIGTAQADITDAGGLVSLLQPLLLASSGFVAYCAN